MAEDKKGILVYADWINIFEALTDEEAGKLIKHFFRYVNDLNPEAPDRTTELLFINIKNTLKRDLEKYIDKTQERAYSGKLGNLKKYQKDLYDKVVSDELTIEQAQSIAKCRKVSLSEKVVAKLADSDSDSDSDSVIKKDINISFDVFWDLYNKKVGDKKVCKQKWIALKDEDRTRIIESLPSFKSSISEKKYLPYPQKYLNQRRWNDEYSEASISSITERIDKYHNLNQVEKQKLQRDILKIPVMERTQREQYVATEKL